MRPLLFQFRTGAGAGGCGSVATLLFAVFVLQLGSSARTVVHAKQKFSDADNYLYHTEDAAGIIIDYEPEKPETATPDFIYGADQGPRVVEFYAPWCPHVCAVIASRIIPGLIIHHLHCTLIVSLTLVSFRLFISNLLSVTIHNGIFHARVRTLEILYIKCRHFRSHYIRFAQQVGAILKEYRGPPVQFYAVSCTANKKLCKMQDVHGYPKIKLFRGSGGGVASSGNATAEIMYWKLHAFDVLDKLQIQVDQLRLDPSAFADAAATADIAMAADADSSTKSRLRSTITGSSAASAAANHHLKQQQQHRTKQQVFDDAYLSFDFNLRNGIFLTTTVEGPLTNVTKAAFRDWLQLVKQTTPVVWQIHAVINAILADFDAAVSAEDHLLAILDRYPAPTTTWSHSCTKGVSGMGYTCGLWQLFHIMSVGLVEYNLMIAASDDTVLKEVSLKTTHAAETLRNFVEHFFACDVCRMNFLRAYDSCALDRCSRLTEMEMDSVQWVQFPVWLFETHNAVNARLLRERADGENRIATPEEEVASQWPSKKVCPVCWLDSGGWNEDAVYKYLRTEYW